MMVFSVGFASSLEYMSTSSWCSLFIVMAITGLQKMQRTPSQMRYVIFSHNRVCVVGGLTAVKVLVVVKSHNSAFIEVLLERINSIECGGPHVRDNGPNNRVYTEAAFASRQGWFCTSWRICGSTCGSRIGSTSSHFPNMGQLLFEHRWMPQSHEEPQRRTWKGYTYNELLMNRFRFLDFGLFDFFGRVTPLNSPVSKGVFRNETSLKWSPLVWHPHLHLYPMLLDSIQRISRIIHREMSKCFLVKDILFLSWDFSSQRGTLSIVKRSFY